MSLGGPKLLSFHNHIVQGSILSNQFHFILIKYWPKKAEERERERETERERDRERQKERERESKRETAKIYSGSIRRGNIKILFLKSDAL